MPLATRAFGNQVRVGAFTIPYLSADRRAMDRGH